MSQPDTERELYQALADLQLSYHRQAEPIMQQLAHLEAMKPPRPVWIQGNEWATMKPDVIEKLWPEEAGKTAETPNQRFSRVEFERRQLLHLLRLILAAGGTLPHFLYQQVERTLKDMAP